MSDPSHHPCSSLAAPPGRWTTKACVDGRWEWVVRSSEFAELESERDALVAQADSDRSTLAFIAAGGHHGDATPASELRAAAQLRLDARLTPIAETGPIATGTRTPQTVGS